VVMLLNSGKFRVSQDALNKNRQMIQLLISQIFKSSSSFSPSSQSPRNAFFMQTLR
jgi:histone H3/H4